MRPPCLPEAASRRMRSPVERGSMPYSAVTQPLPELRSQAGTFSSRLAVHSTCVSPNLTRQEPSACLETPRSKETVRISSGWRLDGRMADSCFVSRTRARACRRSRGRASAKENGADRVACCCAARARSYIHAGGGTARPMSTPDHRPDAAIARRALARHLPAHRRYLSARRRAARLAQPVAPAADRRCRRPRCAT